jgi:hypothetical protein
VQKMLRAPAETAVSRKTCGRNSRILQWVASTRRRPTVTRPSDIGYRQVLDGHEHVNLIFILFCCRMHTFDDEHSLSLHVTASPCIFFVRTQAFSSRTYWPSDGGPARLSRGFQYHVEVCSHMSLQATFCINGKACTRN